MRPVVDARTSPSLARALRAAGCAVLAAALLAGCADRPAEPPPRQADTTSVREIAQGELVGFTGAYGNHAWFGIPFAKPPVGDLRWRSPEPPEPWSGRREALQPGAACPQFPSAFAGIEGSPGTPGGDEDCLTLSIYAPRRAASELPAADQRWPVMVWIHGGGNVWGTISAYEGGNLAQSQGVVVVMLQYRLGPLGWLRHASLRADAKTPATASGNFGTLDMIRGLEWVRDNIAAFGGDPGNVTIFGESAGGRDVISLLVAPAAKGLFHRAISQSGSVRTDSLAEAENTADAAQPGSASSSGELLLRLLQADGRATSREQAKRVAAELGDAETARFLRSKSASEILLAARRPGASEQGPPPSVPNIFPDGTVLPADGILAALGRPDSHHDVPVLLGTNRDENRLFMLVDPNHVNVWFGAIYRLRDPDFYDATAEALARSWKVDGADAPAAALTASGRSVYVYRWDWDEEPTVLGADFARLLGAAHGGEIPFVFGHVDDDPLSNLLFTEENAPGREVLTRAMMSYWSEFAHRGNPGRGRDGKLPEWTAWNAASGAGKTMILDAPATAMAGGANDARNAVPAVSAAANGAARMSPDHLTGADVLRAIDADKRLADPAKRCQVLRQLVERDNLDADSYAKRCPAGVAASASGE
jgi:para-nitrobenzyl esterase